MRFISLDILNPREFLEHFRGEGLDGRKSNFQKFLDRITVTIDDVIAFFILFMAELMATFILLSLGCFSTVKFTSFALNFPRSVMFGVATLISIEMFGWISGAHMNPAVTLAAVFSNRITFQKFLCYLVAQITGGIIGYGFIKILVKENEIGNKCDAACLTIPSKDISSIQACTIEFLAVVLLTFFCCSVWDEQNRSRHESISLRFGFAIMALIFSIGTYTGGSLNPVRTFAPALYNDCWTHHWIYWAGPLTGSLVGTLLHNLIFRPDCWFKNENHFIQEENRANKVTPKMYASYWSRFKNILTRKYNKTVYFYIANNKNVSSFKNRASSKSRLERDGQSNIIFNDQQSIENLEQRKVFKPEKSKKTSILSSSSTSFASSFLKNESLQKISKEFKSAEAQTSFLEF